MKKDFNLTKFAEKINRSNAETKAKYREITRQSEILKKDSHKMRPEKIAEHEEIIATLKSEADTLEKERREALETLDAIIKEHEGRATTRTLQGVDLLRFHDELHLKECGIPKKALVGAVYTWQPDATTFPKAYKYIPDSTKVTFQRRSTGLFITEIERANCNHTRTFRAVYPDEAKEKILEDFYTTL